MTKRTADKRNKVIITFTDKDDGAVDMQIKCIPPLKMKDGKAVCTSPVHRVADDFITAIKETYQ